MSSESTKLWGGRFTEKPDETLADFNRSFHFDKRLFEADVRGSIAHANGLRLAGLLTDEENKEVVGGLEDLLACSRSESGFFDSDAEDIHSFIESRLVDSIGDAGRKLHTGRSRNDQVATAFRLWLREETDKIVELVDRFQAALIDAAERHRFAVLPGYTHLQRAQPILWPHWCLAYFEMLSRDRDRLIEARRRINVMPLGSGALAGTGFPIDRESVARELGFERVTANSLDAVSDRDFVVEFVNACALLMVHLSRLAEDLILYATAEFGFIELSDRVSTGSSLMPQKKNPDALELIRGKTGRVLGHQTALHSILKGLPLAYNKDMQEDKEAVFNCVDTAAICLKVGSVVLANLAVNENRAASAAATGYLNATELADYLVRKGLPFRSAHEAVGRLVLLAIKSGKELEHLSLEEMRSVSEAIGNDVYDSLALNAALSAKSAIGGTSPQRVAEALDKAKGQLRIR